MTLSDVSEATVELADTLFEAGCDDGSPWSSGGVVSIGFDREAASLGDAVGTAIHDVERAGYRIARIEFEPAIASVYPPFPIEFCVIAFGRTRR